MTRETAIALAKTSLERNGFSIKSEPAYAELMAADVINKHLTTEPVNGPQWLVSFPLQHPNDLREVALISIDDITGVVSEGQVS